MSGYIVSKTSFLKLEQCQKAFYFYKKHPYLRDKLSIDKQLTFKRGHNVGYYARELFPGGTDVSELAKNSLSAVELTTQLIEQKTRVIYEAAFVHNGALVMADILVRENEVYNAYEVKSSLKVSEVYVKDACLQYYVIKSCLPELSDLYLVTLNPDYILHGETDPKKLFRRRSIRQSAENNFSYFENRLKEAQLLLEQNNIPNIAVGKHCFRPYQCDFFGACWKDVLNDESIFNVPLLSKNRLFELYESGVKKIPELTDDLLQKEHLVIIKNAMLNKTAFYDAGIIRDFMTGLKEPVVAMDMEIWGPAIPQLQETKPFEQVPFLAGFFDGKDYSYVFLDYSGDERKNFATQLLSALQHAGSIMVYDKTLEVIVINNLIRLFPELTNELEELKNRIHDVFEIFVRMAYYDPAFKNNFSLKGVGSVLLPGVTYSGIGSGLEAMNVFDAYRSENNPEEKQRLKTLLLDYCRQDCYCVFELVGFFRQLLAGA